MMDRDLDPSRHAIQSRSGSVTYDRIDGDPFGLRQATPSGSDIAIRSDDAVVVASALAGLDNWASRVHLLPGGVDPAVVAPGIPVLDTFTWGPGATADTAPDRADETVWTVYTSGTTGTPKPIHHTIRSLSRTVVLSSTAAEHRWGLLYDPNRMAGLQVILQAMRTRSDLVAPDQHLPLRQRVMELVEADVTALSATPTIWRQILQMREAVGWGLRQITLGGEIADQKVLTALASAFPEARIVHVFASTETGAAFSVRDGRAGFPVAYLDDPPRGIELQIRDDILHVHSPGVSAAGPDGFASTGDRVEIVDDRVLFRGRASGVVNVGGSNVWPEEVEAMLRTHPEVVEAVVTAKENPLSGNVLIASVVPAPDADLDRLGKRVRSWLRERVPATHVPAMVKILESVEMSSAGKVQR